MAKQAKFYCENCGSEVAQSARFCNKCGRFFSSVRCPVCGKTGSSNLFADGCPVCGYGSKENSGGIAGNFQTVQDLKNARAREKGHFYVHRHSAKKSPRPQGDGSLPLWVYLVTFLALLASVIGIMRCS